MLYNSFATVEKSFSVIYVRLIWLDKLPLIYIKGLEKSSWRGKRQKKMYEWRGRTASSRSLLCLHDTLIFIKRQLASKRISLLVPFCRPFCPLLTKWGCGAIISEDRLLSLFNVDVQKIFASWLTKVNQPENRKFFNLLFIYNWIPYISPLNSKQLGHPPIFFRFRFFHLCEPWLKIYR